jgi:hypothetical protein
MQERTPPKPKWSLRWVQLDFNLLLARVKMFFSRDPIPNELPRSDREAVEIAVKEGVAQIDGSGPSAAESPPATRRDVESIVRAEVGRINREGPRAPRRRPKRSATKKSTGSGRPPKRIAPAAIVPYLPPPSPAPPRDVIRQTVVDLAAKARKRAVSEGDVVAALAAAFIENEASKPPAEPDNQVRW